MKPALTAERIERAAQTAARVFEVPAREVLSRLRVPSVARARMALYAALYDACETSYPELAWRLHRDHTTLLHGIRRAREWAATDPDYADRVRLIMAAALVGEIRRAA